MELVARQEGVETGRAAPNGRGYLWWRDSPDHEHLENRWRFSKWRWKPRWYESWGQGFESLRGHQFV